MTTDLQDLEDLGNIPSGMVMARALCAVGRRSQFVRAVLKAILAERVALQQAGVRNDDPAVLAFDSAYLAVLEWAYGPGSEDK